MRSLVSPQITTTQKGASLLVMIQSLSVTFLERSQAEAARAVGPLFAHLFRPNQAQIASQTQSQLHPLSEELASDLMSQAEEGARQLASFQSSLRSHHELAPDADILVPVPLRQYASSSHMRRLSSGRAGLHSRRRRTRPRQSCTLPMHEMPS